MTKLHHSPVQTFKIPISLACTPKSLLGSVALPGHPAASCCDNPSSPAARAGHSWRPCIPTGSFLPSGPLQRLFPVPGVLCAFPELVLLTPGCHSGFSPKTSPGGRPDPSPRGDWRASRRRAPAAFLAFPAQCTPLQRALLFGAAGRTRHASLRAAAQRRSRLHPGPAAAQLRPYALGAVQLAQPVLPPRVAWRRGREARLSSGLAGLCPAGQPPRYSGPRAL